MTNPEQAAIIAAGIAHADAIQRLATREPHEAAVAAFVPGGPSLEQLEQRIRDWQAERLTPPTDTSPPTG